MSFRSKAGAEQVLPHQVEIMTTTTSAQFLQHVSAGESQMLEFKASASNESLLALANTQGSTVLVGAPESSFEKESGRVKPDLNQLLKLTQSNPGSRVAELANQMGKPP